jgi:hypothetical protein
MAQRMSAGDALEDAVTPGDPGTRVCRFGGLMWDAEKEQWDLSSQARESCVTSKNTKTVRDHKVLGPGERTKHRDRGLQP